jgi:hypothetical protein
MYTKFRCNLSVIVTYRYSRDVHHLQSASHVDKCEIYFRPVWNVGSRWQKSGNQDSSVGIAIRLQAGWPRSRDSTPERGYEILFHIVQIGSEAPPPALQWVPGVVFSGVMLQGREADHRPPSIAEVRNGGAIPPLPHTSSWPWYFINEHQG